MHSRNEIERGIRKVEDRDDGVEGEENVFKAAREEREGGTIEVNERRAGEGER